MKLLKSPEYFPLLYWKSVNMKEMAMMIAMMTWSNKRKLHGHMTVFPK